VFAGLLVKAVGPLAVVDEPPRAPDVPARSQARVHSIKLDPPTDNFLESVVDLMSRAGFPKAGRSEVVRVALGELRRQLDGRSPTETVKFFLDRDAERRLARLDRELPNGSQ
jgi:hypothetical protein